jgi:hypothetical protein
MNVSHVSETLYSIETLNSYRNSCNNHRSLISQGLAGALLTFIDNVISYDNNSKKPYILVPALEILLNLGEYANAEPHLTTSKTVIKMLKAGGLMMKVLTLYLKTSSIDLEHMDFDHHSDDEEELEDSDNESAPPAQTVSAFHLSSAINLDFHKTLPNISKTKMKIAFKSKQILYSLFPVELKAQIKLAHVEQDMYRGFGQLGVDTSLANTDTALMDLITGMEMLSPSKHSGPTALDSAVELRDPI